MKRKLAIVVMCTLLLATVGAGVVTAKQDVKPNQAGKSSIYLYNVAATDKSGSGRLKIDLDKHTFVFTGHGFEPSQTYYLYYTIGEAPAITMHKFASVTATQSKATVFLQGIWADDITSFSAAPKFFITPPIALGTPLYAELHWAAGDGPTLNGISYHAFNFWAHGSTSAVGVGYRLTVEITYRGAEQWLTVYDGPSISLTDNFGQAYSDAVLIQDGAQASATLTVYDLAGNSIQASYGDIINEVSG